LLSLNPGYSLLLRKIPPAGVTAASGGNHGAAVGFAALVSGGYVPAPDERVGVVISGANTTAVNFGSADA